MGDDIPPWRPHDLRRTAATTMARLGIPQEVTEKVLSHSGGKIGGIAAVYNRYDYLDARKAALEGLGRFTEQLIGRAADNIVPLRQPA